MLAPVRIKRVLKHVAGCVSAVTAPFAPSDERPRVCILTYHRIADIGFIDPSLDSWCVSPARFASQIAALSEFAEFVALRDVVDRLRSGPMRKPAVCLTFDDGYRNFFTNALPVLARFGAPATLFVVTKFVGGADPMPFDRWGVRHRSRVAADAWQPVTWRDLEQGAQSELVTIGAHSHEHLNARNCSPAELMEEAARSGSTLRQRLGASHAWAYAYPYGSTRLRQAPRAYIDAVRAAGYRVALSTDLGLASPRSDELCLPRVEAHALDSAAVLHAKTRGVLGPFRVVDRLRRGDRAV